MLGTFSVNLANAPAQRWQGIGAWAAEARTLAESYVRDLGGLELFGDLVDAYRAAYVPTDFGAEIDAIADEVGISSNASLVANLYYDAMHAVLGCTAFAIDTPDGPLHARNLDWWTERRMLSEHTLLCDFRGAPTPYRSVGWPGFMGVFTGVAEGRFAVSLNAVISAEPKPLALPVTLLLRKVFDEARSYEEAVMTLAETPIASDCLLLVTGTKAGEMVVIERTSTRSALRAPANGLVVVTNDYRAIDDGFERPGDALAATSCGRFDRATHLASSSTPTTFDAAFEILLDDKVRMDITVQSVVMHAASGACEVRLPTGGGVVAGR
ncbi:MAG TPA: hypothetical protein DEF51_43415 [Myxococcales bacterium]|nr:hypothetical protein [Myxococcales bacterium]